MSGTDRRNNQVMFMSYSLYKFFKIVSVTKKKLSQYLLLAVNISSNELLNLLLIQ